MKKQVWPLWKERTYKVREYLYECVINQGTRNHYKWYCTVESNQRCNCEAAAKSIVALSGKEMK